jgi:DNA-binding LytR/AlgR family response regulator
MHYIFTAGVGMVTSMAQGKIPGSDSEDDECVSVMGPAGRTVRLTCSQVSWVNADGHFMCLHTVSGESYRLYGTFQSLLQRWAKYGLVRIHKSFLVFLPHVRELRHEAEGPVVYLGSGAATTSFPVSRRKFQDIKKRLKLAE